MLVVGDIMTISNLIQHLIEWQKRKEMEELTKLLLDYQGKQGLTDSQLADLLIKEDGNCVSASTISYLRSEKRKLGIDTVRAIWRGIPELRNECWYWKFF